MVAAKKIYYLGFYNDCSVTKQERVIWLSAISKMNYIIDTLVRSGFEIEIVSLSPSASTMNAYCGGVYDLKPGVKLRLFPTHSRNNRLLRALNILQIEGAVTKFLCGLEDDDVVLCYHNVQACKLLRKAKTKAGFKLLMEVEELYSDVSGDDDIRDAEIDTFGYADAFLFPTVLLNEVANPQKKPYALCSGVYEANKRIASKSDDGKIHIVYAGTLEPRKGAAAAVAAGALLDERYELHILGGGCASWVDRIKNAVAESNSKSRGCKISYEGLKSGLDFDAFIQSCHIGLSPQCADAEFNSTSFPSKVFMYLSNGLTVVSVDLPVFTEEMRNSLILCADNAPESLAEAIEVAASNSAPCALLEELDMQFRASLEGLIL